MTKKSGPNDKCSPGSGTKAKTVSNTPISSDCKGQVISGEIEELHASAKEAVSAGNDTKASHFYTMAIDVLAKGLEKDRNGRARDEDLVALNKSSSGRLSELLCGRSHVYLRQGDIEAAVEDAETCTRADPSYEKGHLRLAVAYESAGASLSQQLEACERGLENCPQSEILVTRKWRLKKSIAERGDVGQSVVDGDKPVQPWGIEQTRELADNDSDPRHSMAAADLGRSFAAGAHGLKKDLDAAVRYLRKASDAGDVSAQRDLGLVLLDLAQPVEASEQLKAAAEAGDEEAASVMQQLVAEAQEKEKDLRAQLEKLAGMGDPRALSMLAELGA